MSLGAGEPFSMEQSWAASQKHTAASQGVPSAWGSTPLIDSHAHVDSEDYAGETEAVVERAREAGLVGVVTVGFEPAGWHSALALSARHSDVFAAIGIHPNSANETNDDTLSQLAALCRQHNVVAIGETGLDYYRQYASHEEQKSSFRAHLELARQLDLPVIIHDRDAHEDILSILKQHGQGTRGVMHAFSGDVEFMRECLALDYAISLAGPVTFKKAADRHAVAAAAPLNRLLVETDCPYLTPEPFRGRRNEPAYVRYTAQAIANLRDESLEQVARQTTLNAIHLFNLPLL